MNLALLLSRCPPWTQSESETEAHASLLSAHLYAGRHRRQWEERHQAQKGHA